MTGEELSFVAHPHILFSIIQSQAGTLAKALLEGVMNSIDAGASRVSVQVSEDAFSVRDDGRGFQSRDEVLNWFGQFGTPHQDGDAVYGKFRMGRGQMMAFAINTWRTGIFQMEVDIKGKGLNYRLTEKKPAVKGCRIHGRLYNRLSRVALDEVLTEFTALVRYAQIPVSLNGRVVSKRPEDQAWDIVTDHAYIKMQRTGDLLVYNLGVLVRSYSPHAFGCGGIVVSRRPLTVNFARNDILTYSCEVWRHIAEQLRGLSVSKVATKASLNSDERGFLARQWAFGNIPSHLNLPAASLKLFTDATGKHHSLEDLLSFEAVTLAKDEQSRTGARLHREGRAFVLAEETLARFRVDSLDELVRVVQERSGISFTPKPVPFEDLALGSSETYQLVADCELSLPELCVLQALRQRHDKFFQWFSAVEKSSGIRTLSAGSSEVADAWTDGRAFITVHRKMLARAAERGEPAFFELLMLLVHEYCHDTADLESHTHDLVFYNKHHDVVQYRSGRLVALTRELMKSYASLAKKAGLPSRADRLPTAPSAAGAVMPQSGSAKEMMARAQLPLFG